MGEARSSVDIILDAAGGMQQPTLKSSGLTKGGLGDALAGQRAVSAREIEQKEARDIYEGTWLGRNSVDILAGDMTRAGFTVEISSNQKLADLVNKKLRKLKLKLRLRDMIVNGLIDGMGYLSIGFKEGRSMQLWREPDKVEDIQYIHAFTDDDVDEIELNEDPFSTDFGEIQYYHVYTGSGDTTNKVHGDRVMLFRPFPRHGFVHGSSMYKWLLPIIQIVDNAQWSFGQVVYQLVFKVLKVDMDRFTAKALEKGVSERELMNALADDINALTVYVMDKGDGDEGEPPDTIEFPSMSGSLGSVKDLIEFVWQLASAATRMPRSHLIGNEQGKLTGAEWDTRTYYARVSGLQEEHLLPKIEDIVDHLLRIEGKDPEEVDYEVKFNPLFQLDEKTQAEVDKQRAETDGLYIDRNVVSGNEVREQRFGLKPMAALPPVEEDDDDDEFPVEEPEDEDVIGENEEEREEDE